MIAVTAVIAWPPSMVTVLMSAWMPAPPPRIRAGDDQDARRSWPCFVRHRRPDVEAEIVHVHVRTAFESTGCAIRVAAKKVQAAATAAQMSSTIRSTIAGSSPSAMTRISGSVPDLRITSRPRPSSSLLGRGDARLDRLASSSGAPPLKRTFLSNCGTGSNWSSNSLAGLPLLDQRGEHLQPRDQPVAGGRMVGQDDVARLLAADIAARARASPRAHSGRRPGCGCRPISSFAKLPLEPEVGHHRRDHRRRP